MIMGTLTIRNIDDGVKERLRVRAASRGHSMEEEARVILSQAMGGVSGEALWTLSRQLFVGENGVELAQPTRAKDRPSPDFSDH
jgi:plasmid stability protein